jgi:hypothetical protein
MFKVVSKIRELQSRTLRRQYSSISKALGRSSVHCDVQHEIHTWPIAKRPVAFSITQMTPLGFGVLDSIAVIFFPEHSSVPSNLLALAINVGL